MPNSEPNAFSFYLQDAHIAGADLEPIHTGYSERRGHVVIDYSALPLH